MKKIFKNLVVILLILIAFIIIFFSYSTRVTNNFPENEIFTIEKGDSIIKIADSLEDLDFIRSDTLFKIITSLIKDYTIKAGIYNFEKEYNLFEIIDILEKGDFGDVYIHITIPEGSTNKQIAKIISKDFEDFDSAYFLNLAKDKEGYLFPDTYFILPDSMEEEIIEIISDTFQDKIKDLHKEIESSKRSLEEIIIMASIIEKETNRNNQGEANIISGILWKRIEEGIPLQVDAPFLYIIGKESSKLTRSDLKIDSPFNTYLYKGLTPSPIGNPGLQSIKASLFPEDSPYYFYLHDNNANIYYSGDYAGHIKNKNKYLK